MAEPFLSRIAGLGDAELLQYLRAFQEYRTEAVEAALAELDRRGLAPSEAERTRIRTGLAARDAAARDRLDRSFVAGLGPSPAARLRRIRQLTAGLLVAGLGSALAIYLRTAPRGPNPLGYEPEDTKQYLRDLELYGGKLNVLATEFTKWWYGLWEGRNLAFTLGGLTLLAAAAFWFTATRRVRHLARVEAARER